MEDFNRLDGKWKQEKVKEGEHKNKVICSSSAFHTIETWILNYALSYNIV